jgi:hypothetical protein
MNPSLLAEELLDPEGIEYNRWTRFAKPYLTTARDLMCCDMVAGSSTSGSVSTPR